MKIEKVLVVDDEKIMRDYLSETLNRVGYDVEVKSSGQEAMKCLEEDNYDLIFTDVKMPNLSGMELLQQIRSDGKDIPVVMMTAYGTVDSAVEAMKSGADDYILKPFSPDQIDIILNRLEERTLLKQENAYLKENFIKELGFGEIVGQSESLQHIFQLIEKVSLSKATVLVTGETGTGKELIARSIHFKSNRKEQPFVKVNCASIPENLLESELFGHEKGSFTGAISKRTGRFELANKGTLFLDEIGEMSLSTQTKLLRVLQEREFERVGSSKTIKTDVRIIAATNKNLEMEVEKGTFREDLFYRINVIPMTLPPLRQRTSDIPLLVEHFVNKYCKENRLVLKTIDAKALNVLMQYEWPGNIRELENLIERIVVINQKEVISEDDIPLLKNKSSDFAHHSSGLTIKDMEKKMIIDTLKKMNGNRTHTAQKLGISIRTLRNKLREYRQENLPIDMDDENLESSEEILL